MTDFITTHRLEPGERVRLNKIDTDDTGPFDSKEEGKAFTQIANDEIRDLQYRMFVENRRSMLIVLQAPDAAGKDGLIRKVLGRMNPQGCRTYPFKAPTSIELEHDFLWRVHKCTPSRGMVSVFNRSHYEDVLVVRVEDLVPKKIWSRRYEIIRNFEAMLTAAGTKVLKFYLHISRREQLERFQKRLENPEKHWKLNMGDYDVHDQWDQYRDAYEDAMRECSTDDAPWFVIPADRKWYRDAAVAGIVRQTFEDMDPQMPDVDVDLSAIQARYDEALARFES